jgi:hypothetical protein
MFKLSAAVLILLALVLPVSYAQQSTLATTPITVGQAYLGTNYYYVYNLPLTIGANTGTAWMDVQGQRGFILFRPSLEGSTYIEAQITSWTVNSTNSVGLPLSATVTYWFVTPTNSDNDTDFTQGSITFNYTWQQNPPGFRRGWYVTLTGGSGMQSITQD